MLEFDPYDYSYPNGWMYESFDAFRRKDLKTNTHFLFAFTILAKTVKNKK